MSTVSIYTDRNLFARKICEAYNEHENMYENTAHYRPPEVNPFAKPESTDRQELYNKLVKDLAQHYIYDEGELKAGEIKGHISRALRTPIYQGEEKQRHELETLLHLLQGIEAHERANAIHGGAWQAVLDRQIRHLSLKAGVHTYPTRGQVNQQFSNFIFKKDLLDSEQEALDNYSRLLDLHEDTVLDLNQNIGIHRTDVQVLINDIRVRIAERLSEDADRLPALHQLDEELKNIIDAVPAEQTGKKYELKEIYLLRKLVHAVDSGHLVSISHGTPRADLRPDRGSVDIEVAAAGQVFSFQLKTFNRNATAEARTVQLTTLDRAANKLRGSDTHLVVLDSDAVGRAYDSSLRQTEQKQISRLDKYSALSPLCDIMSQQLRSDLLNLLGLTENDLEKEKQALESKQKERGLFENELKKRREAELAREAEIQEAKMQAQAEALAKQEADRQRREQAITQAQEEREAIAKAKQERMETKRLERESDKREREAREAEVKKAMEELAKKQAEAEKRRQKREAGKKEIGDWPPQSLAGLFTADMLKAHGLLTNDWSGDPMPFMAAKKRLITLFAKPQKGSPPNENSKPNKDFNLIFPDKKSLLQPNQEDIARLKEKL